MWEGEAGLLVDLGLSYKQTVERMEARGIDPYMFGAALITHGHGDHQTSVRKWIEDHSMEIWCTRPTINTIEVLSAMYPGAWREVKLRELFEVKSYRCYAVPSVHNAEGAVTYVVEAPSGRRLVLFVETGVVTAEMFRAGRHSHAYIIEANHDKEMCAISDRPQYVNERTMLTHLNNGQAAKLIEYIDPTAALCVLVHLSSENNDLRLVEEVCAEANARRMNPIPG